MIDSLVEGFLLGLGAAVPIGPVNILIMNEALISYRNAIFIGAGAMSADLTYLSLILFGLFSRIKNNHTVLSIMGIAGSIFLMYLSFSIFKSRNARCEISSSQKPSRSILMSYLKGYPITLLNPYTIGFWLSVTAYIATNNMSPMFTVLGLIFAISLWITIMPFLIHKTKKFMAIKTLRIVDILSSMIILFFGISMFIGSVSFIK